MKQAKKTNVFTYGSLMYPQVIGKLVKQSYLFEKCILIDFQRRHVKNAVYPGLTISKGKQVQGVLYYQVNQEDMNTLDYFQSVQYKRTDVQVITLSGKSVAAIVYEYVNASNLQDEEWRVDEFQKEHKHNFADNHLQVKRENRDLEKQNQN